MEHGGSISVAAGADPLQNRFANHGNSQNSQQAGHVSGMNNQMLPVSLYIHCILLLIKSYCHGGCKVCIEAMLEFDIDGNLLFDIYLFPCCC
jgi:hypothetical protein